jgi:hypothetical protein
LNEGVEYENTLRPNHMLQKISHRMNAAHRENRKWGILGKPREMQKLGSQTAHIKQKTLEDEQM